MDIEISLFNGVFDEVPLSQCCLAARVRLNPHVLHASR